MSTKTQSVYPLKSYFVRVKHGRHELVFNLTATSPDEAVSLVTIAEKCPRTAVLSVQRELGGECLQFSR